MHAGKSRAVATLPLPSTKKFGISVGVPLADGEGVIAFDFTLDALSQLLTDYKITENAVIMVGHSVSSVDPVRALFAGRAGCLQGDVEARKSCAGPFCETIEEDRRIDREITIKGIQYRLIVHRMAPGLRAAFSSWRRPCRRQSSPRLRGR